MYGTFVLFVSENRFLQHLLISAMVVRQPGKDFFTLNEVVTNQSSSYKNGHLSIDQKQIVDTIALYEDKNLSKVYNGKKKPVRNFIETIDKKLFTENIRPFIDSCIVKCLQIALENNIPVYNSKNGNTNFFEDDRLQLVANSPELLFNFEKTDQGLRYHQTLLVKGKEQSLYGKSHILLSKFPCRIVIDDQLFSFNDVDGAKLIPFFTKKQISVPAHLEHTYFETFILTAITKFQVNAQGFDIIECRFKPRFVVKVVENLSGEKCFFLDIHYGETVFEHHRKVPFVVSYSFNENVHEYRKIFRDFDAENTFILSLLERGLAIDNHGFLIIGASQTISQWISSNISFFVRTDCVLMHDTKHQIVTEEPELLTEIANNNDWFDVKAYVKIGANKFPFVAFRKHILSGNREFIIDESTVFIIPEEWFARYVNVFVFGEDNGEQIKLKRHHFSTVESFDTSENKQQSDLLIETKVYSVPQTLKAELRPYQIQGFSWLCNRMQNNFGACLADDMGLGKTLQTIALLLKVSELNENSEVETTDFIQVQPQQLNLFEAVSISKRKVPKKTSLIVMPASLIHNWFNEFRRFAPSLHILKFAGGERISSSATFSKYDVVLTTYGYARNTIELFASFHFNYIILDESQMIKNPYSKTYESLCRLQSKHKLVLTGTPIENKLLDLWSQMNFINPGILGNLKFFKETYVENIERNNQFVIDNQKNVIKPFLLRRHKQDVLTELPDKQEQVVYCKMSSSQEKIYVAEKSKIRNEILDKITHGQSAKNMSINILQAMMRLRQIASHPALCNEDSEDGSGKFDEIIRSIENVIEEGHKVLIFSSFVAHLNLIKQQLDSTNIKSAYLTGETRNRETVVASFQKDETIPVFLISIKAGGVGLNLTQADYVFIIDPWWNPAVEEQAISRSHRMGQKNNVFVYRFISENTIEEKIQTLQHEKNKLALLIDNQETIEFSEENVLYLLD
jgi:superfamily II DNA or RNA helicase